MITVHTLPTNAAFSSTLNRGRGSRAIDHIPAPAPSWLAEDRIGTPDDVGSRGVGMRYTAELTAGSLKVPESRIVARLLLDGVDQQGWKDAIEKENVLQARNTVTAKRLARLIRQRLETMDVDLWKLVR